MTPRDQRKQDLLLASQLLRLQAEGAVDELSTSADRVQARVNRVVSLWNHPTVRVVAATTAALWVGRSLRRPPAGRRRRAGAARLLRWGLVGWRMWHIASPAVTRWLQSHPAASSAPVQGTSKPSI